MKQLFVFTGLSFLYFISIAQDPLIQQHMMDPMRSLSQIEHEGVALGGLTLIDSALTFVYNTSSDSSIQEKQYYVYNEMGKVIRYESWIWDDYASSWLKYATTIDYEPSKETQTYYHWSISQGMFLASAKTEFVFQSGYFSNTYYSYQIVTDFVPVSKEEIWYNSFEQDSIRQRSEFDDNLGEWLYVNRNEYAYDKSQNLIARKGYVWENSDWNLKSMYEFIYNDFNNLITQNYYLDFQGALFHASTQQLAYDSVQNLIHTLSQTFNNNEWVNSQQQNLAYDSISRPILTINEQWDPENNQWLNIDKRINSYNYTNGTYSTESIDHNWNSTEQEWIPTYYYLSKRNEVERVLTSEGALWSTMEKAWTNFWKHEHAYLDTFLTISKSTYSFKYSENAPWDLNRIKYYFHFEFIPSANSNRSIDADIFIYPNPSKDYVFIHFQELEDVELTILNMHGQILNKRNIVNQHERLDLTGLPIGTYILRFENSKLYKQIKLLKVE